MLQDIDTVSREAGLTINVTKTKVMTNSKEIPIRIGQAHLDYVHQYVYLGQTISLHASTETEVKQRIGIAWTKFWSLKFILLDKKNRKPVQKQRSSNNVSFQPSYMAVRHGP